MTYRRWLALMILTVALVGCSSPTPTITPVITAPSTTTAPDLRPSGSVVVASGVVLPARSTRMGYASPVTIETVEVQFGDAVKAGQVLIRLAGQDAREAALASARMELVSAQEDLDDLYERAPLVAAESSLELANARDALHDAQRRLTWQQKGNRATKETIEAAKAQLVLAEEAVDAANRKFNAVKDKPKNDPKRAAALVALDQARERRDAALASLNWYTGEPTDIDQAIMEAEVEVAVERVSQAAQKLERWKNGPDPGELARLEERLARAQAQVEAAQEQVEQGEIRAPFDGIITEVLVNPGETVMLGQAMVVVSDLEHLQIETTDLSERDVDQVSLELPATIFVEPLGIEVPGRVTQIALSANTVGGDVVYTVTLDLDQQPEGLRWGMSVEVEIEVE
jgi:HlyD family secretion protein